MIGMDVAKRIVSCVASAKEKAKEKLLIVMMSSCYKDINSTENSEVVIIQKKTRKCTEEIHFNIC